MKTILAGLFFIYASITLAQSKSDSTKIKEAALNYIDGWYAGDTLRMDKALHPDLVKSTPVSIEQTKGAVISTLSKSYMVEMTKMGVGKKAPREKIKNEVKVLDIHENIASVKVTSFEFTDYLHLIRVNGDWKILQVLWVSQPKKPG